jgi:drug/metabolite transporter (DMT)-like permease
MTQLGIPLALACAVATNVAFLCKHRGAVAVPAVEFRHPLRSAIALFRSHWWAIGFAVGAGAWVLHVAALSLAPLSLVETVISGSLVLLAWFADRLFGLRVGRREWLGLGLAATGLALLGATASTGGASANYSLEAMIPFEAGAVALGALLLASGTFGFDRISPGALLGIASGLLFGVANVAIKALTGTVPSDLMALISPWTAVAVLAGVGAFFGLARGLQTGAAVPVIALTAVSTNCASILGGILVFADPVGSDPVAIVGRSIAFAAVILAAALIPGPRRVVASAA